MRKKIVVNLYKKMRTTLPREIVLLLKKIGSLANAASYKAFLVGGSVRDMLLGARNLDLDIVVEGDAIELGKTLSKKLDGSLVVHRRFGTCTVMRKDKPKIDLATARKETYAKPGALPTVVEFGSLKEDLARRDFTINAMAVSLNKENFGQLIDFFGGETDLAHGRIRVMHEGSFIDDPTRIFRAVRFEQRFRFAIDSHTEYLIRNAMAKEMFDKVNPQRIRDEIIFILKEKEPVKSLKRMSELHELRFIHPKIRLDKSLVKLYKSIDKTSLWYGKSGFKKRPLEKWLIYLMALFEYLNYKETSAVCNKYVFRRGEALRMLSYKKHYGRVIRVLSGKRNVLPSKIYKLLEPLSYEVILLTMAKTDSRLSRSRIKAFLKDYSGVKTDITGSDIVTLGLRPGPDFKKILRKVLYKKIDGILKTRQDELRYAAKLIRNI